MIAIELNSTARQSRNQKPTTETRRFTEKSWDLVIAIEKLSFRAVHR